MNLPGVLAQGAVFTLTVSYAGRIEPQSLDQEVIAPQVVQDDRPIVEPEGSLLYSNRGYWYPQTSVSDYATATIRLTLPTAFGAVCSGDQAGGSPVAIKNAAGEPRALFVFAASQPVRYLACVVSRLLPVDTRTLTLPEARRSPACLRHRRRAMRS